MSCVAEVPFVGWLLGDGVTVDVVSRAAPTSSRCRLQARATRSSEHQERCKPPARRWWTTTRKDHHHVDSLRTHLWRIPRRLRRAARRRRPHAPRVRRHGQPARGARHHDRRRALGPRPLAHRRQHHPARHRPLDRLARPGLARRGCSAPSASPPPRSRSTSSRPSPTSRRRVDSHALAHGEAARSRSPTSGCRSSSTRSPASPSSRSPVVRAGPDGLAPGDRRARHARRTLHALSVPADPACSRTSSSARCSPWPPSSLALWSHRHRAGRRPRAGRTERAGPRHRRLSWRATDLREPARTRTCTTPSLWPCRSGCWATSRSEVDGRPVDLGGPKPRALLALLVAADGRPVPVERLVDQMWGEDPPARVEASLQSYVARLRASSSRPRRALAGHACCAPTPAATRSTSPTPTSTPAASPTSSARPAAGRRGPRRGGEPARPRPSSCGAASRTPGARSPSLARRGDPAGGAAARARSPTSGSSGWTQGSHAEAVAALEQLVGPHPLQERLWALLALALYRSPRQGDALAALRRAREHLDDELGVDPGPSCGTSRRQMLRQDPSLDLPARVASTRRREPPAAAVVDDAPAELDADAPARPDDALAAVAARPSRPPPTGRGRLVVVCGEPGIGKTRLAEAVAELRRGPGLPHRARRVGRRGRAGRCGLVARPRARSSGRTSTRPRRRGERRRRGLGELRAGRRRRSTPCAPARRCCSSSTTCTGLTPRACGCCAGSAGALRTCPRCSSSPSRVAADRRRRSAGRDPRRAGPPRPGADRPRGLDAVERSRTWLAEQSGRDLGRRRSPRPAARAPTATRSTSASCSGSSSPRARSATPRPRRGAPCRAGCATSCASGPGPAGGAVDAARRRGGGGSQLRRRRCSTCSPGTRDAVADAPRERPGPGPGRRGGPGSLPVHPRPRPRRRLRVGACRGPQPGCTPRSPRRSRRCTRAGSASTPPSSPSTTGWPARRTPARPGCSPGARRPRRAGASAYDEALRLTSSPSSCRRCDPTVEADRTRGRPHRAAPARSPASRDPSSPGRPPSEAARSAIDRGDAAAAAAALLTVTESARLGLAMPTPTGTTTRSRCGARSVTLPQDPDATVARAKLTAALASEHLYQPGRGGSRPASPTRRSPRCVARASAAPSAECPCCRLAQAALLRPDLLHHRRRIGDEIVELARRLGPPAGPRRRARPPAPRTAASSAASTRRCSDVVRAHELAEQHHLSQNADGHRLVPRASASSSTATGRMPSGDRRERGASRRRWPMSGYGFGLCQLCTLRDRQGRLGELEPILRALRSPSRRCRAARARHGPRRVGSTSCGAARRAGASSARSPSTTSGCSSPPCGPRCGRALGDAAAARRPLRPARCRMPTGWPSRSRSPSTAASQLSLGRLAAHARAHRRRPGAPAPGARGARAARAARPGSAVTDDELARPDG